jgi:hypothetical protein
MGIMRQIILALTLVFFTCRLGVAQILDSTQKASSGVSIVAGDWDAGSVSAPRNADATYNAFSTLRKGALGQYDFYYSLEVVPQFSNNYSNCSSGPNVKSFLQQFFGTTTGAIVVVKTDVQYRWTTGTTISFLSNDAGLVVAGVGATTPPAAAGFGCYFDTTIRPTFPLLQYNGGGANDSYDDFVMKFIVTGGSALSLNLVSTVVSLFNDISAAVGWTAIVNGVAGPASQAAQKAAQSFQDALTKAGTVQNQVSVGYTLKANGGPADGRLAITIPNIFGSDQNNGNLVIYVRRTGSIVLANMGSTINFSTVLDNPEIPARLCNLAAIASGSCGPTAAASANTDPLRVTFAKQLKSLDSNGLGDGTGLLTKLIDMNDKSRDQTKVFNLCKGIRTVAREFLHLSTLDETMVRWVFTKEGGLQDMMTSAEASAKKTPPDLTDEDKLAKATGAPSFDELSSVCWNDGDQQTLEGIAKVLSKTIVYH